MKYTISSYDFYQQHYIECLADSYINKLLLLLNVIVL